MPVQERRMAAGRFDIRLRDDTPRAVLDQLDLNQIPTTGARTAGFGVVVVTNTRIDNIANIGATANIEDISHPLMWEARFCGIYRALAADWRTISGPSIVVVIGDENNQGDIIDLPHEVTDANWGDWMTALIQGGTIGGDIDIDEMDLYWDLDSINSGPTGVIGIGAGRNSRRNLLTFICTFYSREWRIKPNGRIEVGTIAELYTERDCIISRHGVTDTTRTTMAGQLGHAMDLDDYVTEVVAEGNDENGDPYEISRGTSTIYRGPRGRLWRAQRRITANGDSTIAYDLADADLARTVLPRRGITLEGTTHDIDGPIVAGQYARVWDPQIGLYSIDPNDEIVHAGDTIRPVRMRIEAVTWPVTAGMGVYLLKTYNANPGGEEDIQQEVVDLTDWIEPDEDTTKLEVGDVRRIFTQWTALNLPT